MKKTYEERIQEWQDLVKTLVKTPYAGILPSPPDPRDYSVEDIPMRSAKLPSSHKLPPSPIVLNQGQTGYCAGASAAGIANAYYHANGMMPDKGFSMAFVYWLAKQMDGIPHIDGTYIRTVLKVMHQYGCAPETLAPYSTQRIRITAEAVEAAKEYKIEAYARLHSAQDIKQAMTQGLYVIFGTLVTRDNWNRPKGFLSFPQGQLYGGHATFGFEYDDLLRQQHVGYCTGQNSWGSGWGDGGKFYLPYDYMRMTYNGQPVFLEAWGVKFPEVDDKKKPIVPKPPTPEVVPKPKPIVDPRIDIFKEKLKKQLEELKKRLTR